MPPRRKSKCQMPKATRKSRPFTASKRRGLTSNELIKQQTAAPFTAARSAPRKTSSRANGEDETSESSDSSSEFSSSRRLEHLFKWLLRGLGCMAAVILVRHRPLCKTPWVDNQLYSDAGLRCLSQSYKSTRHPKPLTAFGIDWLSGTEITADRLEKPPEMDVAVDIAGLKNGDLHSATEQPQQTGRHHSPVLNIDVELGFKYENNCFQTHIHGVFYAADLSRW